MSDKINSNSTGLSYAKEDSLRVLPVTPIWKGICPNSYSDFGSDIKTVARKCINVSRQRKKGTVVDIDASGGFNVDLSQNNIVDFLQGFLFADAHEKPTTKSLNGAQVAITSVAGGAGTSAFNAASGLESFKVGSVIFASGFANAINNGPKTVAGVAATSIQIVETLVVESTPSSDAFVQTCGFAFGLSDLSLTASASSISITTIAKDFTTMSLNVGEWIFIGGDEANKAFANNVGFARISAITTKKLNFDNTTFTAVTESGTGKSIKIYNGVFIRNEETAALIKRTTYQLERTLGEDNDGTMSEYLEGSIPNELKLNIPTAEKATVDLSFVSMDNVQRTGLEGLKTGTRVPEVNEDAINTSSNIYRVKLSIVDPLVLNNPSLFGYVSEASIDITNNAEPLKAISVLGSFEASEGDFEVSGSLSAFFTTVEAVAAVRNNRDAGFDIIFSNQNAGQVFDIPLLSLGNGKLNVEIDSPIKLPLDTSGAENDNGYTLSYTNLPYLPDLAMA